MTIAIGSDHAGFELKQLISGWLTEQGHAVTDLGTHSADSVDYPDFAHPVANAVETGRCERGILVCGSGNGVCMTANKHAGIRAALCWTPELAALSRQHNNANILCLPARFISAETGLTMVGVFVNTAFEGGRHEGRVGKIGVI
ncbi:MAG: ribose 5-phosphate isomerase B [Bacteroidota bacterium]